MSGVPYDTIALYIRINQPIQMLLALPALRLATVVRVR